MPCRDAKRTYEVSRRQALAIGSGLFGLSLPGYLQAAQRGLVEPSKRELSCIFVFCAGGPSHFETFDPKPDAPASIRGLWKPTSTSVPGTFITEKMPLMAQLMHQVTIVRSWRGRSGSHAAGSQHVTSGMFPPGRKQHFPNVGCLASTLLGSRAKGMPSYFGLPVAARYTYPTGYLGPARAAFDIKGDPSQPELKIESLRLPRGRFDSRQGLLTQLENLSRVAELNSQNFTAHDEVAGDAVDLLTSGAMQQAVRLDQEPNSLRERYGMNIYGQRVLLARRLVEAGARFVTINQAVQGKPFSSQNGTAGTWDNHQLIFERMLNFGGGLGNVSQLDLSLSALLTDLDQRGMLDSTLVVVMGEFGRTPKINKSAGRDHYPAAGNVLLAGAGISRGAVIGATDRNGTEPATRPWYPEDFAVSIYHALGIDAHKTYFPRIPRPTPIANGQVIDGLFS